MTHKLPALHFGSGVIDAKGNSRIWIRSTDEVQIWKHCKKGKKVEKEYIKTLTPGRERMFHTFMEDCTISIETDPKTEWSFQFEHGRFYKKLDQTRLEVPIPLQVDQREQQLKAMINQMVQNKFGTNQINSLEEELDFDINDDGVIGSAEIMNEDDEMVLKDKILNTPDEKPPAPPEPEPKPEPDPEPTPP